MVSIEEGIFAFLSVQPELSALIEKRIFPMKMPHDTKLPAVTFQKISGVREEAHTGSSHLARPRFQFTCWAEDYQQAKNVALKIIKILHAFKGVFKDVPVLNVIVDLELDQEDEETKIFQTLVDVTIWHTEIIQ